VPRRFAPRPALLAVVAIFAATLAGCGSDAGSDGAADDSPTGTSLTIAVTPDEDAKTSTYELTCDPAGGDHPQPKQACAALAKAGADVFDPVPADRACTMIYGGPQTATIKGTYDGAKVDASFSRDNGCEIDRWEKLGTTVFNLPLQ
jgi:hypothetical protein